MKPSHKHILYVLKNGGHIYRSLCGGYRLIDRDDRVKIIQHRTIVSMKEAGLLNSDLEYNCSYSKPSDKSILTDADRATLIEIAQCLETLRCKQHAADLRRIAGEKGGGK